MDTSSLPSEVAGEIIENQSQSLVTAQGGWMEPRIGNNAQFFSKEAISRVKAIGGSRSARAVGRRLGGIGVTAVVVALAACGSDAESGGTPDATASAGVVNVYSHRHYDADQELFDRFAETTGIEVNVVTASADELITRLQNEGASSPADVLITVDAGRLHRAKELNLLQPIQSSVLEANVPEHLRDRDGQWYGLTQRARIIAYARDRVQPSELSTYAALAGPEWRGRILIRSSSNVYNQSLLAAIIANEGPEAAESWAAGIVANMAREPAGGDTDQIKAVAAGAGDIAITNTYYLAQLYNSDDAEDRRVAEQIGAFFPDQGGRGTHVNVSGAGVTRNAPNRENAIRLIEFLSADEAQGVFAEQVQEYPVKPGVARSATLQEWGEFQTDNLDLTRLGELNSEAVRIFDRVGWR
jgi:iron(III) transport system substrate-binding protein